MKNFLSTLGSRLRKGALATRTFVIKHKLISAIIALVVVVIGYWGYTTYAANTTPTQYSLAEVTQGPLVVTVTDSGTVNAKDTLNLTPQNGASGQIKQLNVTPGQAVKAGQIIAELDMTTAAEQVTTARQNLESAEISYKQAQTSSGSSINTDQANLTTAEGNNATALGSNYTDLPTVMNGLNGILFNFSTVNNYTAEKNVDAYANLVNTAESHQYNQQVQTDYQTANAAYQRSQAEYAGANPSTLTIAQLQQLDQDTIATDVAVETALKDTLTYYTYINNEVISSHSGITTPLASQISSLTSYQSTITSDASSVNSSHTALINDQQTLQQDTQTLGIGGGIPLTVQSAELNVEKAQAALNQALTTESYDIIRAPFDGIIGSVPVNKFDQASGATTIATLITTEEYADLSLNQTDAAKVKVGQPATMTFDAVPNFTMPGQVATVNPVGTVTQGVTTYDVKVSFAQQNSAIKPGMSVNATITTASSSNAIQVPSSAITTRGNFSLVKVATIAPGSSALASSTNARRSGITVPASQVTIKNVPVTLGLSNDTTTEIVSGLTPGEYVVTAMLTANSSKTKTAATSATSVFGGSSNRSFGGGFGGGSGGARATSGGSAGGGSASGGGAAVRSAGGG